MLRQLQRDDRYEVEPLALSHELALLVARTTHVRAQACRPNRLVAELETAHVFLKHCGPTYPGREGGKSLFTEIDTDNDGLRKHNTL